ncbi:MAG: hypothetical protein MJ252_06000 [archaeon]|nr:hypothetical protein [archaeon]
MSEKEESIDKSSLQARSLWIGEIENWMTEEFIEKRFLSLSMPVKSVKIIKNRQKGICLGYGFIEFFSHSQAEKALNDLSDKAILAGNKTMKLNWATDSASKVACMGSLPKNEFTIYVGELEQNISEEELKEFFMVRYKSVLGAKLIIDNITKISKGYGFVRFSDQEESKKAILEMNGRILNGRYIRVK